MMEQPSHQAISSGSGRHLWPFSTRAALKWTVASLVGLLLLTAALRRFTEWPSGGDAYLLVGIFVVSLLPTILAVLDMLAERRGVIEFRGVKLDFSAAALSSMSSFAVPQNIGVPGHPVTDSDTTQILEALRSATASEVVIIDLLDGHAWWETRLLVLLAGAMRRHRPSAVVFVATEGGVNGRFQGWGSPSDLFPLLLKADPQYRLHYARASAAAQQWSLVEPLGPGQLPPVPSWAQGFGATLQWMAFDGGTGLPNRLAPEQFLQSALGQHIEQPSPPRAISTVRLQDLFRPVLRTNVLDEAVPSDKQVDALLSADAPYLAVTRDGRYLRLLPRLSGLAIVVRSLVARTT